MDVKVFLPAYLITRESIPGSSAWTAPTPDDICGVDSGAQIQGPATCKGKAPTRARSGLELAKLHQNSKEAMIVETVGNKNFDD